MLQCVFTGKAQEAYSALSSEDCKDFDRVKSAVLKAHKLVTEAYTNQNLMHIQQQQTLVCSKTHRSGDRKTRRRVERQSYTEKRVFQ